MSEREFAGRRAVVTGGAAGIGRAIVEGFAAAGAIVVFSDVNEPEGRELERTLNEAYGAGRVRFIRADMSAEGDIRMFAELALDKLHYVDALVNNVGVNYRAGSVLEHEDDDYERTFRTNALSAIRCIRAFLPGMLERRAGAVVSLSSTMALGAPGFSAYAMVKSGIEAMTRTLALEYAADGIRFNAVAPGAIATPATRPWLDREPDPARAKGVPMGRIGTPGDVANAALFLASPRAAYVTGQVLYVDGGLSVGE